MKEIGHNEGKVKLLIADDETHIRIGLTATIDWTEVGIKTVYSACDGEEAYKLCTENKIEIILTDIRMPGIDGIELGRRLKYSPRRIIIMSGFDDFTYAQSAIKLGVSDYLLKPVNIEQVKTLVHKLVLEINAERSSKKIFGTEKIEEGLKQHQIYFGDDSKLSIMDNNFSSTILQVFDYVNMNYSDNLNVSLVARLVKKSNNYFSSYFKKSTGCTFIQYLAMVRVFHAKIMLRNTTLLTYEIAEKVGFSDYKYFSNVFKQLTGFSPSEYRCNCK